MAYWLHRLFLIEISYRNPSPSLYKKLKYPDMKRIVTSLNIAEMFILWLKYLVSHKTQLAYFEITFLQYSFWPWNKECTITRTHCNDNQVERILNFVSKSPDVTMFFKLEHIAKTQVCLHSMCASHLIF